MDDDKVMENIDAINEDMSESKFTKKEIEKLKSGPDDVRKVKYILSVLEPIEEDITLFGGEKFSTGIVVLPVLTKLKKRLAPDEKYPIYIVKLKKDIKDDMAERCNLNLTKKVVSKSSFFDKRFDKLKFLEDDKRSEVIIVEVKEELLKLQEDGSTEEVTLERLPPEKSGS